MPLPDISESEWIIMEALWEQGASSIREIQQAFAEKNRPAYTTVQTTVYRLEAKKAIRRVKKISNAHIFEAVLSRIQTLIEQSDLLDVPPIAPTVLADMRAILDPPQIATAQSLDAIRWLWIAACDLHLLPFMTSSRLPMAAGS